VTTAVGGRIIVPLQTGYPGREDRCGRRRRHARARRSPADL